MKKMNMVEKFGYCVDLLNGKAVEGFTVEDAKQFLQERQAQAQKKSASGTGKPTAKQIANEEIKEKILIALQESELPMSVGDIGEKVGIDSNQHVTSLLTQLRNANKVVRTEVKGKAYYSLPIEVEGE